MTVKRTSLEAESIRSLAAASNPLRFHSLLLFSILFFSRALVGLLSFLLSSGSSLLRQPRATPVASSFSLILAVTFPFTFPLSSDWPVVHPIIAVYARRCTRVFGPTK